MHRADRFFQMSLELMCVVGLDGYLKDVNPSLCRALGYSAAELLASPYLTFIHPGDRAATAREVLRVSSGIDSIDFEARLICKHGELKWLSWRCTRVGDELFATARDISHFKELETTFRDTFENAGVGLAHVNFDGQVTRVNQEFCDLLGYDRDTLMGTNYNLHFAPEDLATPAEHRAALQSGKVRKITRERQLLKRDGTTVWVLLTSTAVRDKDDQARYFILAHKDITRRKAIEESFRALVEAIPQIVWTATPTGEFDFYNQRWYDYTGFSATGDKATDWRKAIHPEDVGRCAESWTQAVNSGESYETEYRIRNGRNGTYRWQLARALPLLGEDGSIIRWFGTYTDIDDQKRTQERLRQSLRELKRSSEERAQLLSSERAAIEASRLKSEFLATMTHEIRTPLNGVIAMAGMMMTTPLSEHQKEYTETIAQSADSLLSIVNDILDLSKIEAGKLELEIVDFDLRRLLNTIMRVMEPAAQQKGISLSMETLSDFPASVRGDPSRLRQIAFNLIQNAIKFTEKGSVKFRVRETGDGAAPRLRFEVVDTGIGIAAEATQRIWSDFEQADASTTRRYGGTGLGLAICKRLAEMMGGSIGVQSELGAGSTFWFETPCEPGRQPLPEPSSASLAVARNSRPLRILVAEDHSINQKVIRRVLESLGHQTDVVADGAEALEAIQQAPYDLVILDCHMPRMDGFAAARAIRELGVEGLRQLPIIALTADVLRGTREKCRNSGMNYFASKPIELAELRAAIEAIILDAVLDPPALDKLRAMNCAGMREVVGELLEDFLREAPAQAERIRTALQAGRVAEMSEEAHSLKSASATLGALRLSRACRRLEDAGSGQTTPDQLPEAMREFQASFEQACRAMEKMLAPDPDRESVA